MAWKGVGTGVGTVQKQDIDHTQKKINNTQLSERCELSVFYVNLSVCAARAEVLGAVSSIAVAGAPSIGRRLADGGAGQHVGRGTRFLCFTARAQLRGAEGRIVVAV